MLFLQASYSVHHAVFARLDLLVSTIAQIQRRDQLTRVNWNYIFLKKQKTIWEIPKSDCATRRMNATEKKKYQTEQYLKTFFPIKITFHIVRVLKGDAEFSPLRYKCAISIKMTF